MTHTLAPAPSAPVRSLPEAVAARARLADRLRDLGAPCAGFGTTWKEVGGANVPALLVFATPEDRAAAPGMDEFEGFPLVWHVRARAA